MKIFCRVFDKPAVVVGYGPGRKGRIRAIVITQGQLKDVALKDIVLDKIHAAEPMEQAVTTFGKRTG